MRLVGQTENLTEVPTTYLIESYWPDVTRAAFLDGAVRAEMAAQAVRATGRAVSFLGSVLVPEDQVSFWRFAGNSLEDVKDAGCRAGLHIDRITECIEFNPARGPAIGADAGR